MNFTQKYQNRGFQFFFSFALVIAGVAQLVERNLAKVKVAGSRPVSRSKILPMRKQSLKLLLFIFTLCISQNHLLAQKKNNKDPKKENEKLTEKPGRHYTYTVGSSRFNPETGKYEPVEGEWKKQPEQYAHDPQEWKKPKHSRAVYGKNPIKRLFRIKPKTAKPETTPSDKQKSYTTGEEEKRKE